MRHLLSRGAHVGNLRSGARCRIRWLVCKIHQTVKRTASDDAVRQPLQHGTEAGSIHLRSTPVEAVSDRAWSFEDSGQPLTPNLIPDHCHCIWCLDLICHLLRSTSLRPANVVVSIWRRRYGFPCGGMGFAFPLLPFKPLEIQSSSNISWSYFERVS